MLLVPGSMEGERKLTKKRKEIKCEFQRTKEKLNHIEPGDFFSFSAVAGKKNG